MNCIRIVKHFLKFEQTADTDKNLNWPGLPVNIPQKHNYLQITTLTRK